MTRVDIFYTYSHLAIVWRLFGDCLAIGSPSLRSSRGDRPGLDRRVPQRLELRRELPRLLLGHVVVVLDVHDDAAGLNLGSRGGGGGGVQPGKLLPDQSLRSQRLLDLPLLRRPRPSRELRGPRRAQNASPDSAPEPKPRTRPQCSRPEPEPRVQAPHSCTRTSTRRTARARPPSISRSKTTTMRWCCFCSITTPTPN